MPKLDLANGAVLQSTKPPPTDLKSPGRKLPNWLMAYSEYTAANEAPEVFHMWVALGTLAGAVRRRAWLNMGYYDVLTNMYIILVAPAGTARKTTALKIGQSVLKHVPGVHFTTKATSTAALIQQFANLPEKEHQSLTAYAYELGSMLKASDSEMVDIITDLYDGNPDWDKQTVGRGLESIPRPWLNILGGVTPRWLGDNLPSTAVEGGLVSRTLWIYADERKLANPRPKESPEMKRMRELLINDLTHISTLSGIFEFSAEAGEFYDAWYLDPSRFPNTGDERVSGYYERKHIHVLKVAMALSLAERDDLVITVRDIQVALGLLDAMEPGMQKSFVAVGKNVYANEIDRMLKQIKARGPRGMGIAEISHTNYHALGRKELDDVLAQLLQMGAVKFGLDGRYVATDLS